MKYRQTKTECAKACGKIAALAAKVARQIEQLNGGRG